MRKIPNELILTKTQLIMFTNELKLTMEELRVVKGGGDPDGEGSTGRGNGEQE